MRDIFTAKKKGSKGNQNVQFRPLKQDEEYPPLSRHFNEEEALGTRLEHPLTFKWEPPPLPSQERGN